MLQGSTGGNARALAEHAVDEDRSGSDPGPRAEDRSEDARVALDHRPVEEHRIVDLGSGSHHPVVPDDDPSSEARAGIDLGSAPDPRGFIRSPSELSGQEIEVCTKVLLVRAEIAPIRLRSEALQGRALTDQGGEDFSLDPDVDPRRPPAKDRRLEDIRPCVDVAGDRI